MRYLLYFLPIIQATVFTKFKTIMNQTALHSFHIPVLGIGYSIDTPVKVARYGISSVLSIMDDQLIEKMREYHSLQSGISYDPIPEKQEDHRAKRITAYLNLLKQIVTMQVTEMGGMPFNEDNDLSKYFALLPEENELKVVYLNMMNLADGPQKEEQQDRLRQSIIPGAIDVNVMSKLDRDNYDDQGNLLPEGYSDALAAFRGFAESELNSSIVFSAGYNPRLYNYIEQFSDFYPDEKGQLKKKIILKVSDYRSALVQGKLLAKKGLWISEFRIESGLNCGGHAFPTEGLLLGPILEEFKNKRDELASEIFEFCNAAIELKGLPKYKEQPKMRITVQGGIGTANENNFLLEHYVLDGTGWGSPFLLVPETTNVEEETLQKLATAIKEDYYVSYASPLGIAFNNFHKSTSEQQRHERIDKNRPGSPCYKKFLATNTEFTESPICIASREYQDLKIKQLKSLNLSTSAFEAEMEKITEKDCLCEGLGASVLLKDHISLSHNLSAVAICPGPNLAYFSGTFSLTEMVGHIYGRINLLNTLHRPNMFINELNLYIDHFKKKISEANLGLNPKQVKQLQAYKKNLLDGIDYYNELVLSFKKESSQYIATMKDELEKAAAAISTQNFSFNLAPATSAI
jgi:hypothetical protein